MTTVLKRGMRPFPKGLVLGVILLGISAVSALAIFLEVVTFRTTVSTASIGPVDIVGDPVVTVVDPAGTGIVQCEISVANVSPSGGGGGPAIKWLLHMQGGYTGAGCDIQISYINKGGELSLIAGPSNYKPIPLEVRIKDDFCGKELAANGGIATGTYKVRVSKIAEPGMTYGPFDVFTPFSPDRLDCQPPSG